MKRFQCVGLPRKTTASVVSTNSKIELRLRTSDKSLWRAPSGAKEVSDVVFQPQNHRRRRSGLMDGSTTHWTVETAVCFPFLADSLVSFHHNLSCNLASSKWLILRRRSPNNLLPETRSFPQPNVAHCVVRSYKTDVFWHLIRKHTLSQSRRH